MDFANIGVLVYSLCERRKLPVLVADSIAMLEFRDCLIGNTEAGSFPRLKRSNFCTNVMYGSRWNPHINVVRYWNGILLAPVSIPGIMTINTVMALQPESVRRLRRTTLTRLTLQHCQIDEFNLDGLLAATPRLLYLEYHASVEIHCTGNAGALQK
jgi:hypothetical protein